MTRATRRSILVLLLGSGSGLAACEDKAQQPLAPVASALAATAPQAARAVRFVIDAPASQVTFSMQAPLEKISGEAPGSASGEIFVDLENVARSTGLVRVDLEKLTLFQEKRDDERGTFGARSNNELQNEHARTWLEISDDAPADVRGANRFVEFRIDRVENASHQSLLALSGAERRIEADVVGDFRLHGRKNQKRARVEIRVRFAGQRPESLSVRTLEPLAIGLEEYDVRPREAFGKLAQKTLGALGSKVATSAPVEIELRARAE